MNFKKTRKWSYIVAGAILLLLVIAIISNGSSKQQEQKTSQAKSLPTEVTQKGMLTADQKAKVVAILTANVDHYKKLWQDGKDALGTTQYASSYDGLAALNDPTSAAAKFSAYKKSENPANDNSMIDAMDKADAFYPSNVSDQPLHTWSDDMGQVSVDIGVWITDATGWQIQTVKTERLTSDANIIMRDLATVQKDIDTIGK